MRHILEDFSGDFLVEVRIVRAPADRAVRSPNVGCVSNHLRATSSIVVADESAAHSGAVTDDRVFLPLKCFFSMETWLGLLPERSGVRLRQLTSAISRISERSLAMHRAVGSSMLEGLHEIARGCLG